MITILPAHQRFSEDLGWLKTYWLFSFSHYYDPRNLNFGVLRVFNDDVVAPASGFPDHSHANFEIVTIVLSGAITHTDSLGNEATVGAGEVQRMSAGRGVTHSEWNRGKEPVHLYQLWFIPNRQNTPPSYAQEKAFPEHAGKELRLLVSGRGHEAPLSMSADADIYGGVLESGTELSLALAENEGVFGYLERGTIELGGNTFGPGDQFRISGEPSLSFTVATETKILLIRTSLT